MGEVIKHEPQAPVQTQESAQLLSIIERVASNPEADIDKLERMLNMHERIMSRNAEQAFNAAMAEMQDEIPVITKSGQIAVNGQVRSKYARFEHIMEAVRPIMKSHGFAVSFRTETTKDTVKVTGILMHKDGHREQTEMVLPFDGSGSKNTVQQIGSSTSYGKRYVLTALLNIATGDEDDDGQGAFETPGIDQIVAAKTVEELQEVYGGLVKDNKGNRAALGRIIAAKDVRKQELMSNGTGN